MKPVSGKRMCQILGSRGWRLARISGSHHIYRHPDSGRRTSVPVHGNADLKPRTQRSIMRDAGLTSDGQPVGNRPSKRVASAYKTAFSWKSGTGSLGHAPLSGAISGIRISACASR